MTPITNSETGHPGDEPSRRGREGEAAYRIKESKSLCPETLSPFPYKLEGKCWNCGGAGADERVS
jgi:hypothetical protein